MRKRFIEVDLDGRMWVRRILEIFLFLLNYKFYLVIFEEGL